MKATNCYLANISKEINTEVTYTSEHALNDGTIEQIISMHVKDIGEIQLRINLNTKHVRLIADNFNGKFIPREGIMVRMENFGHPYED